MAKNKIYFIDVTNRDGVQTSRIGLAKLEKTMLNMYLDKMGIFQSEFGFPVTLHEKHYLNANLELVELGAINNLRLSGWIRAVVQDVEKAFELVPKIKYLNLSISTSKQMLEGKFGGKVGWEDLLQRTGEAIDRAYELGAEAVGVNAEDASRTELEKLIEFTDMVKTHGGKRMRYCDTLGYDDPMTLYDRIKQIAESSGLDLELHCHNDLGMAVACSVMGAKGAVDGGVDAYINTTVNGIGERSGNADLVSCVLAMKKSSGLAGKYEFGGNIDLTQSWKIAHYASRCFGIPLPINQVAVGANAFAHESGIHVDGALKDHRNYELYDHDEVGRGHTETVETGRQITTGEYSGIKGFKNMAGKYEVQFKDEDHARMLLELVRYANVHKQQPVTADEIRFICKYPEQARKIMTVTPLNGN
ncbi:MAG: homocitrate synthase [Candidatus Altiarchaeota archaeon]|nr:homocitrate synthase [Candidatus Altiarchaeota archaeon]